MAAYWIILHTDAGGGDVHAAPEVFLTLFGTKGSSPELVLGHEAVATPATAATAATGGARWAGGEPSGEGELVDLGDIDLGDITRVRVRHDPGVGPGSYLDRIVVRSPGTLEEWTFVCERWLTRREGDGTTEHTLDVRIA